MVIEKNLTWSSGPANSKPLTAQCVTVKLLTAAVWEKKKASRFATGLLFEKYWLTTLRRLLVFFLWRLFVPRRRSRMSLALRRRLSRAGLALRRRLSGPSLALRRRLSRTSFRSRIVALLG